ncbi:MAG: hypothetical protein WDZ39_00980 [Candidatus Spechtbacterales bacterium]
MGEKEREQVMRNKPLDRVNVLGRPLRQRDKSERNIALGEPLIRGTRRRKLSDIVDQELAEAFNGRNEAEARYRDAELDLQYEDQIGRDAAIRTLDEDFGEVCLTLEERRVLERTLHTSARRPEPKSIPSPGSVPYVGR